MVKHLKNLEIDEVALVDAGANQHAKVCLYKAKAMNETCPDCGEEYPKGTDHVCKGCKEDDKAKKLKKQLDGQPTQEDSPEDQSKQAAESAMEGDMAENTEKLQAELDAVKAERDVLKTKVEALENTPEQVEKRKMDAMPEEIRKRVEAAEKKAADAEVEIAKMREAVKEKEVIEKCAGIDGADVLVPVLKRLTDADQEPIIKALKALTEQVKAGELFKAKGSDGNGMSAGSAVEEINKRAADLAKADNVSLGDAQAKIFAADPELYDRYRAETSLRVGR